MQNALQRLLTSKHDAHATSLEELRQKHKAQRLAAADAHEVEIGERLQVQLHELERKHADELAAKVSDLERQTAATLAAHKMQSQVEVCKLKR